MRPLTRDQMIEIASAAVLSVAGLTTTWSGYQSALWDGNQASLYAEAGSLRTIAAREAMDASTREAVSVQMFSSWLNATAANDDHLAGLYRSRFPVEFRPVFEKWLALKPLTNPQAPPGPFAMPEYEPLGRAEQLRLEKAADAALANGQIANDISDSYLRATVMLATAMFFAGMSQVFRSQGVRVALVLVSALACAWGVGRMITLPVAALIG